jgi:sugar lactone lactonase YvrE
MSQPRQISAEPFGDARAELGEGPVWEPDRGTVLWVDILGRQILRTTLDGETSVVCRTPSHVGAVAQRSTGGVLVALVDGFWVLAPDATTPRPFATRDPRPGIRFNDGKCDPLGRFIAGTMAYSEEEGAGELLRLEPDGTTTGLLDGITISNGLGWSPDGGTMYYIDSPTGRVDAMPYDVETGALGPRRSFVAIPASVGLPDGLAVDEEGGIWVALWGGGRIHRYDSNGALDAIIQLPVTYPTSCAFGGPGLDLLFVTSAWSGLDPERIAREPHAGGLFVTASGVRGLAVAAFKG